MKACCGICETEKYGFYLYQMFICYDCEREMVATPPEAPVYQEFVEKLRGVYQPKLYS